MLRFDTFGGICLIIQNWYEDTRKRTQYLSFASNGGN